MATKTESKVQTPEAQLQSFNDMFDPKHQKFISSIRAALRKRLPTANELAYDYSTFFVIAYAPNEQGIDAPISFAARADRVDLYFNYGPKLPDPKKVLKGSGKMTRFIEVESAKQLTHPDVEAFIAAAVDLSTVPMPTKGKGSLIIKTNKRAAARKPARPKAKK